MTGPNLPSPISFSYDAASRVVSEALNGEWSVSYGYDKAGNRTSINDGTISRTMGYGTGNRETSGYRGTCDQLFFLENFG